MSLPLVIPSAVQVRLLQTIGGQLGINVLTAIVTGAVTVNQTLANALGSAIKTAYTSNLGALMATSSSLVRVGVRDLRTANQAEFLDAGAAVLGTGVGDSLPAQTAACITLRTALSGKSFRGRVYVGGFTETQNDASGFIVIGAQNAAVTFITAIDTALKANGMALAVGSRPAEEVIINQTTNHNNGTTTVKTLSHQVAKPGRVTQVTVIQSRNGYWETQRRRVNARGALPAAFGAGVTATL